VEVAVTTTHEVVVQRGPRPEPWRQDVIDGWSRYDPRLTDPDEWSDEFEAGPQGPALHVLVLDGDRRVAGHPSLIPLAFRHGGRARVIGKGEAIYVDRNRAPRGAQVLVDGRPARLAQALGSVLFAEYASHGFDAYIGYGQPQSEARLVEAGCKVLVLPYERFFFLNDVGAMIAASPARVARGLAGRGARLALTLGALLARRRGCEAVHPLQINEVEAFTDEHESAFRTSLDAGCVVFEPSRAQLEWRFPAGQYRRFVLGSQCWGYVVITSVESTRRIRVVDWLVPPSHAEEAPAVARFLAQESMQEGAAALEWTVPVNSRPGAALARSLRSAPLVRDPRRRSYRMLVHGGHPFRSPGHWLLTLATQERF
jgi:hypothetical protein